MKRKPSAAADLPPEHTSIEQALRNFHRGLKLPEQMQLAFEVAFERSRELCLAYDNLVAVTSGFRTRRDGADKPRLVQEPCIGFVVRKKWRSPGRSGHPQALPGHLLAFATIDGRRMLCAIPTDVRTVRDYGKPMPHDGDAPFPFGILVDRPQADRFATGVAPCAIRRPAAPGRTDVLGCRHVMSRTLLDLDVDQTGLDVLLGDETQRPLGASTAIRGALEKVDYGFDAQLTEVSDPQVLKRALSGLSFDPAAPFITRPGDVPKGFWIATGRRDDSGRRKLVWVDYLDPVQDFTMPYTLIDGTRVMVKHRMVLHGVPEEDLGPGDSGSPAVRVQWGQRLVGMYIGGDKGHAYVIPAWQLLTPMNLGRPGESGWTMA